jgi:hypothetical protein
MTPEIIEKLNKFLNTHEVFTEECETVYLMVELRKLLEREHRGDQFSLVRFYCDWTVHTSKDRGQAAIKDLMEKLNKCLGNGSPYPTEDAFNFFSLSELRRELSELFRTHGLRTELCQDDRHWTRFVDVLVQVLADQPITNPIRDISSVSFVAGNIGTKTVTVEFTDGRPPVTFGIGD